jgi:LacI family transcriptional regulator
MALDRKSITMKDVANKAGVSIATASRVLNGHGYSSDGAKTKVNQAAQELGYRPNDIARSLKLKRTDTIGLVITDIVNPFYSILASGVLAAASKHGYHVIVSATDENPELESEYLQVLMEKRAIGVIAVCTGENLDCWREAQSLGIKVVFVDREIDEINFADIVLVDNHKGAYDAVSNLINLGHRRIGIINGPITTTTGKQRLAGYIQAHQDAGIEIHEELQKIVTFKGESGHEAAQALLRLDDPPSAIFATNNVLGQAAMFVINDQGLKIPEDISFVIFDDVPWASLTNPSVTVVSQPTYQLGYESMELLHERLDPEADSHPGPKKLVLDPELIIRESIAQKN